MLKYEGLRKSLSSKNINQQSLKQLYILYDTLFYEIVHLVQNMVMVKRLIHANVQILLQSQSRLRETKGNLKYGTITLAPTDTSLDWAKKNLKIVEQSIKQSHCSSKHEHVKLLRR